MIPGLPSTSPSSHRRRPPALPRSSTSLSTLGVYYLPPRRLARIASSTTPPQRTPRSPAPLSSPPRYYRALLPSPPFLPHFGLCPAPPSPRTSPPTRSTIPTSHIVGPLRRFFLPSLRWFLYLLAIPPSLPPPPLPPHCRAHTLMVRFPLLPFS